MNIRGLKGYYVLHSGLISSDRNMTWISDLLFQQWQSLRNTNWGFSRSSASQTLQKTCVKYVVTLLNSDSKNLRRDTWVCSSILSSISSENRRLSSSTSSVSFPSFMAPLKAKNKSSLTNLFFHVSFQSKLSPLLSKCTRLCGWRRRISQPSYLSAFHLPPSSRSPNETLHQTSVSVTISLRPVLQPLYLISVCCCCLIHPRHLSFFSSFHSRPRFVSLRAEEEWREDERTLHTCRRSCFSHSSCCFSGLPAERGEAQIKF